MKKMVIVLVSLAVAVLIGVEGVFAQDDEWELIATSKEGDFVFGNAVYFNKKKIYYSKEGVATVWFKVYYRGKNRKKAEKLLIEKPEAIYRLLLLRCKYLLADSQCSNLQEDLGDFLFCKASIEDGETLSYAEQLWEFNCPRQEATILRTSVYSSKGSWVCTVKGDLDGGKSFTPTLHITPESFLRVVENYVCKKYGK